MDFLEYAAQIPEAAEESDSGTEVTEEILNSENVWFWSEVMHCFKLSNNCFSKTDYGNIFLIILVLHFTNVSPWILYFNYIGIYNIKGHTPC